jgi:uncharacterized protein (TIGR02246 family)
MRILSQLMLVALCLLPLGLSAQIVVDSAKVAAVKPHIDASNAKWIDAHRKGDAKLLASLFVDDGAFLLSNGRVLQGPENIEKRFGEIFSTFGTAEMTITTLDVWVIDSLAYEYGRYTQKLDNPPDGDTTTNQGMYFEVWKQLPDGRWKILRDAGIDPDRGK